MKAIGYTRVSSTSQASPEKTSLERQAEKIRLYAAMKEWELVIIYEEPGVSGATMDRPALQELLADAVKREFQAVLVWDISRFGRNLLHLKTNTELLRSLNITFVSIDNGIDTSRQDKTGDLLLNILASIYEFERETIMQRTIAGRVAKIKDKSIFQGNLGFGYRWNDKTVQIEINGRDKDGNYTGEAAVYLKMVEDYLERTLPLTDLATKLQCDKIPTRFNGKWYASTIVNTFRNTIHKGITTVQLKETVGKDEKGKPIKVVVDEVLYECEPLISPSRWDELQKRLTDGRSKRSGRPLSGADRFILRDLLQCGVCGSKVVPRHHKQPTGTETLNYACYWKAIHQRKLDEYHRDRCILPHIPAPNLDEYVYNYVVTRLIHHEDPEQESPLTDLVDGEKLEDKILGYEQHLQTLKDELARNERGLRATRKSKEAPGFADFENYNTEVAHYLKEIAETKQRMTEVSEQLVKVQQAREDQEKFAEFAKSEQVHEMIDRLWELGNEDRHKLLEGLLDGPVIINPPEDVKLDTKIKFGRVKWLAIKIRPNMAILQDILDLPEVNNSSGECVLQA
jgi:site-specific DNA recombinase